MKFLTQLLVISIVFYGFYAQSTGASPAPPVAGKVNNGYDTNIEVSGQGAISDQLTDVLLSLLGPYGIPLRALRPQIKDFLNAAINMCRTLLDTSSQNGNGSNIRNKRSTLTVIESTLSLPLNIVGRILNSFGTQLSGGAQQTLELILPAFATFVTTQFLPWLHDFLDGLSKTRVLPAQMQSFIQTFDTVYMLLQVLGYVK